MDDIRTELEDLEVQNYEQKSFVPHDALKKFLTGGRVAALIGVLCDQGKLEVWQQPEINRMIIDNGLRLFATLLSVSRPELILKFKETDHYAHGDLDSRLPLTEDSLGLILKVQKLSKRFYKHQWKFLVPFFRAGQSHRKLQDSVILPFTASERLGEGGFGEIDKMTMPAPLQGLVQGYSSEVTVIRKQIRFRGNAEEDFHKEENILSFLRCLEHPNIIKLLAAYTIHNTHFLLFPQADGDMKHFFQQQPRLPGFESINETLQALYELASAIEAVHDYFSDAFNVRKIGCHFDLKPENILYRSGNFLLSDFGLSRLAEEDKGSKSLYRNGGAEYWAPECHSVDEDFKKLPVGRSKGPLGISKFSNDREVTLAGYMTGRWFHEGSKPSIAVSRQLSTLGNKPTTTDAQRGLIVVIKDLLHQEPKDRPKARDTTYRLFHIAQTEIYDMIEALFRSRTVELHFGIGIEHTRFQIWGEVHGFESLHRTMKHDSHRELKTFSEMRMVRECLRRLHEEMERVSAVLGSTGQPSYNVSHHIQKIVDDLWGMQPPFVRKRMTRTMENRLLSTEDANRLQSLEVAFQGTNLKNPNHELTAYRSVGLLAAMKQIASALEIRRKSTTDMEIDAAQIDTAKTGFHWHTISKIHVGEETEKQILIEYLEYKDSWLEATELIQRVQDIASFRALSFTGRAFPVLASAGYFHDLKRVSFGIVYYFPPHQRPPPRATPAEEKPDSLYGIISTVKERTQRPSLDQVFSIALEVVNVVLTMHTAGWLHKNISSYNIIFFRDRFNSIAEAMTSPYMIGFSYSRLGGKEAFTQGPSKQLDYQHPDYVNSSKRFRQEYDYYSVGLVLLELGLWKTLNEMTKNIPGNSKRMLAFLIKEWVPRLKTYMGSAYEEAVLICLNGDFGEGSDSIEVRETFEQKVLSKIKHPTY